MKVSAKVIIASSLVLVIAISLLSLFQYKEMTNTLRDNSSSTIEESSDALALQITNWLNGKLEIIRLMSQVIDSDYNADTIQQTFDAPLLKEGFLIIFGGLDTDGIRITNDLSWNPETWDARSRPWYALAKKSDYPQITEPYFDSETKEILITVAANITDKGVFKGAFGGDLSLKTVSDSLNTLTFNGAGYAFLLTKSGNIISHPNSENNGKNYKQIFADKSLSLDKKIQEVQVDGKTLWVSFIPLEGLRGMNWYIGVVVDSSIVMADANTIGMNTIIGGIVCVFLSILLIGAMMKKILQPVYLLSTSLTQINSGNGDLTKRLSVNSNDEFGDVATQFNLFVGNLQNIIVNVKDLASEIDQSTQTVSNESEKASKELNQQLTELDQLATAMNEMASSAMEVASNAQIAAQSASVADKETANGVAIFSTATNSIDQLAIQMETAVKSVVELAQFSNNIESILTVITGISEQTNLLALNAAIEAARAGETGRGFAVVADEVRSLASRTQESTNEIRSMIEQLQNGVRNAESNIKESREIAMNTSDQVSKANGALETIRSSIAQMSDMNIQIATAAEQQSSTTEEINRNTNNIRDISQEVSKGALEQVKCAQLMKQQVKAQDEHLVQFKV